MGMGMMDQRIAGLSGHAICLNWRGFVFLFLFLIDVVIIPF